MSKRVLVVALVVAALGFASCSAQKHWFASGGSRADGVVHLSYTWALFEKPVVDPSEGVALATSKCAGWGYTSAQPFGGIVSRCNSTNYQGKCNGWIATAEYQCVGSPK